jgi:hypothetical protein
MNIGATGHLAISTSVALPARESLRSATAESLLGLTSPSSPEAPQLTPSPSPSLLGAKSESDTPAAVDAAGQPVATPAQEQLIQQQIAGLSRRDREVRAHEQAHSAVGGNYAGGPTYTFKRGPDGRSYAVGGEVGIDVSPVANDPAATIRKMEQVARAALAPAEPSGQDRRVAAQAQVFAAQARVELAAQQSDAAASEVSGRKAQDAKDETGQKNQQSPKTDRQNSDLAPNLQLYRRLAQPQEPVSVVDVIA